MSVILTIQSRARIVLGVHATSPLMTCSHRSNVHIVGNDAPKDERKGGWRDLNCEKVRPRASLAALQEGALHQRLQTSYLFRDTSPCPATMTDTASTLPEHRHLQMAIDTLLDHKSSATQRSSSAQTYLDVAQWNALQQLTGKSSSLPSLSHYSDQFQEEASKWHDYRDPKPGMTAAAHVFAEQIRHAVGYNPLLCSRAPAAFEQTASEGSGPEKADRVLFRETIVAGLESRMQQICRPPPSIQLR